MILKNNYSRRCRQRVKADQDTTFISPPQTIVRKLRNGKNRPDVPMPVRQSTELEISSNLEIAITPPQPSSPLAQLSSSALNTMRKRREIGKGQSPSVVPDCETPQNQPSLPQNQPSLSPNDIVLRADDMEIQVPESPDVDSPTLLRIPETFNGYDVQVFESPEQSWHQTLSIEVITSSASVSPSSSFSAGYDVLVTDEDELQQDMSPKRKSSRHTNGIIFDSFTKN